MTKIKNHKLIILTGPNEWDNQYRCNIFCFYSASGKANYGMAVVGSKYLRWPDLYGSVLCNGGYSGYCLFLPCFVVFRGQTICSSTQNVVK